MNFDFTEEQLALGDSLRRYLRHDYGFEQRQRHARSELGYSEPAWRTYAEMGVLAIAFPEEAGGLGGSMVDVMLVMQALGSSLALEPFVSTVVLCGKLIEVAGSAQQRRELLASIGAGDLKMALAHFEPGRRYDVESVSTRAERRGDSFRLSGDKSVVLDAPSADTLIVSARIEDAANGAGEVALFLVDPKSPGVTLRPYVTHDGARAADVFLDRVELHASARLGAQADAVSAIHHALDLANIALCCEAVAIIDTLNANTLDYVKTRKQFGVPIGSFQVVQHRLADMIVAKEQADAITTLAAARAADAAPAERSRLASGAKALVCQQARFVGQQAVQLHGGMGLAYEHSTGHYFKRLTVIGLTYGDADTHLARFSATLLHA